MKKNIAYFVILAGAIIILIILVNSNEVVKKKIVTVDTLHSYVYDEEKTMKIGLYFTEEKFPATDLDSYENFRLHDFNKEKNIQINLEQVTYSHTETHQNIAFYKYIFEFELPKLDNDFFIEKCFLEITLKNNEKITMKIGDVYFNYLEKYEVLNWKSIDSKKDDSKNFQINIILVELETPINNIQSINMYGDYEVEYKIENNIIHIIVPKNDLVVTNVPIWITTTTQVYLIDNYDYVLEYDLLNLASRVINVYDYS